MNTSRKRTFRNRGRRRPGAGRSPYDFGGRTCSPSSRSCAGSMVDGASVSGSLPDWVFGNAITSRMFSSPARIATSRSMPKAKPGVRRRAEAERVEQEAEARLGLLGVDTEQREDPLLDVGSVDPHAAGAQLPPVEHEVVRLRPHRERVGLEPVDVVGVRHRERVMRGDRHARRRRAPRTVGSRRSTRAAAGRRPPAGRPRSSRSWPSTARVSARSPAAISTRSPGCAPSPSTMPSCSASDRNFTTGDSSVEPSRHAHPHESGRAQLLRPVDERVDLRTRQLALPGHADPLHRLRAGEGAELGRLEHLRQVDELHPETEVGLVDAVALHRVEPRHRARSAARVRRAPASAAATIASRDHVDHVVLIREAHLRVELHELELAVGAQVLVAQAARRSGSSGRGRRPSAAA